MTHCTSCSGVLTEAGSTGEGALLRSIEPIVGVPRGSPLLEPVNHHDGLLVQVVVNISGCKLKGIRWYVCWQYLLWCLSIVMKSGLTVVWEHCLDMLDVTQGPGPGWINIIINGDNALPIFCRRWWRVQVEPTTAELRWKGVDGSKSPG